MSNTTPQESFKKQCWNVAISFIVSPMYKIWWCCEYSILCLPPREEWTILLERNILNQNQKQMSVLVQTSIAIKRHHDEGNSYKETSKCGALHFRGSVHYHHGGTWWHTGRHGVGKIAESSTSCSGRQEEVIWDSGQYLEHISDIKAYFDIIPQDQSY